MRFYLNTKPQANGDHEIHQATCIFLPKEPNRIDIGEFKNCDLALIEAKKHYDRANGCFFCSRFCYEGKSESVAGLSHRYLND